MKIRHLRWYVAALLFASTVINYIDRQTLSVVAPVLTRELNISPTEYGYILQSFLAAYTIMYVVSGILVDRWGTKASLAAFVGWWSVSNVLHVLARSATQMAVFRFLLGVGEPGNYSAAGRAASEWYPPKERAFINGLANAGSALGAIIATPLVVWVTARYGWRSAFVVTGAMGLVWVVLWLFLYELPERHRRITPEELALIQEGSESSLTAPHVQWAQLWVRRDIWGLLIARFFSDPVWWFYLFWMPKYLVENRGFTLVELGLFAWLPYLTSDIGSIAGGYLSGKLLARDWRAVDARYAAMLPAALFMPASIGIAFVHSSALALALICAITFCHMIWKTNLMTITNDLFPVEWVGSVSGIVSLGSGLGGILFMNFTGRMVEALSYGTVFVIMGFLHPAAFLACRFMVPGTPVTTQNSVEQPLPMYAPRK